MIEFKPLRSMASIAPAMERKVLFPQQGQIPKKRVLKQACNFNFSLTASVIVLSIKIRRTGYVGPLTMIIYIVSPFN